MKIDSLPYDLSVSTPTGIHGPTSHVCLNCVIHFSETCTTLDLLCLLTHNIDIIIGVDWLSLNHAFLDCF